MVAPSPLLSAPGMAPEMARVDLALRAAVANRDPHITELATHLISAGGKRQRPALAIVAAGACGGGLPAPEDAVLGGVAVELVQVGSLYHDDVIDDTRLRRGVPTANARFGNREAILGGDYLLAKASELAARLGTAVSALLGATIASMCEGQVLELRTGFDVDRAEAAYLESIAGKTASVFAAATRIGGIVVDAPPAVLDGLTAYGHAYGMTFQLVDDVLDLVATEAELGKPAGHDMAEGVYTLPVIRALAAGDDAAAELRSLLGHELESADTERARKLVRAGTGVDQALELARHHAAAAGTALDALPAGPLVDTLRAAALALVEDLPAS
ncbi:MAG: polyprenyl synthetase family protein [Acidimicrobiia bacterium]